VLLFRHGCNTLHPLAPLLPLAYLQEMVAKSNTPGTAAEMLEYKSGKASRRFLRNLVWVLVVGSLFLGGQGIRYYLHWSQSKRIMNETERLYKSVLGPDIGTSPFGRLQFEHGKLLASSRIGLDPLNVLAALSRPAGQEVRLDGVTMQGLSARVRGFYAGDEAGFKAYLSALMDNDQYLFSLYKSDKRDGGVTFILTVEPQ